MKFYYVYTCTPTTPRGTQLCPTAHVTPSCPVHSHTLPAPSPGLMEAVRSTLQHQAHCLPEGLRVCSALSLTASLIGG